MPRAMSDGANRPDATRLAIAATTGNLVCVTAAISATFGTFLVPISTEFDWPRATVSGVLGVIAIVSALTYPFIGRMMDRFGVRPLVLGGNAALAILVSMLALSSDNIALFYLLFAAIGIAGAVCSSPMIAKAVSNWFDGRRGLMLGLTAGVGNGIGATIMPIVAAVLLPILGWRGSYAAIGALVFVIGFPVLWLWLHDTPGAASKARGAKAASEPSHVLPEFPEHEGLTLGEAMRTSRFWVLLVAVAAGAGGTLAVFTHVVPMMTDRGFGLGEATGVVVIFALVTAAWQAVTGALLDRFRTPLLVIPMYTAAMGGIALLQFGTGSTMMVAAGFLLGIGMGAEYGALSYFLSRYFGLRHFGTINGAGYSAVILAQGLTPALMDMSFDTTGSYDQSSLIIIAILGIAMGLLFLLPSVDKLEARSASAADEQAPDLNMALAAR